MANNLGALVFIEQPSIFFPAFATVLAIPALGPAPSFVPLVVLVSTILIHSQIIARRPSFALNAGLMWIGTTVGATIGQVASSMTAVSSPVTAVFTNVMLAAISSICAIVIVFLDRYGARAAAPWTRITFFPALWATAWQLIARFSPVGHLMTWTPTQGIDAYVWMRPYFGPWGINWVVAAFAVIMAEGAGSWFIGADTDAENAHQVTHEVDLLDPQQTPALPNLAQNDVHRGPWHIAGLFTIALLLALPSYFIRPLPLSPYSDHSTAISVGCILPERLKPDDPTSPFEAFLEATKTQVNHADLLLWPESAVRFESVADREEKLQKVQNAIQRTFVAVTFEEPAPDDGHNQRRNLRRNGLALVGPEGVVLQYYKRNLVPFVESFPLLGSNELPSIFELPVRVNKGRKNKVTHPVPITASICLDFASPRALDALPSRPAVVLAPARTWHRDVSLAMWEQARARAEETGSMVLFCDGGEDGVSGVAGGGMREVSQVGSGSWTRAIGVENPFDESKTLYAAGGDWAMAALSWGILGGGWAAEIAFAELLRLGLPGNLGWIRGILVSARDRLRALWSNQNAQGEQQPLLA